MTDTILYDSAMRLFGDLATPAVLEAAERGVWPADLWEAVAAAGYPQVLADGLSGMAEATTILRVAGYHAAPIPLAETMLAHWLAGAAGLDLPEGAATIAPVEPGDRVTRVGDTLAGRLGQLPWGRDAAALALVAEEGLYLVPRAKAHLDFGANLAGEPRDHLAAAASEGPAKLPDGIDAPALLRIGVVLRAAQMAGAMEAALDLSARYAGERIQFGRPIAKFQAIQQQLALLAEHAAASWVAVESAAIAVAEARSSAGFAAAAAKIRAGEAAGKVAEIAHQVHGAIGFTHEHSLHRLTRRLWSWRDEFGDESHWSRDLGRQVLAAGAAALWPTMSQR